MSTEDEIDLKELLGIFWRRRMLVCLLAVFVAAAGVGVSLLLPKSYTAMTMLAPVSGGATSLGGASSVLSEYKGLAALAGFSSPEDEKKAESIALLKSNIITQQFIQQNQLLPILFASKWNAAEKRWRGDGPHPTLWEGAQYFQKKIESVREDTKSSLVVLSIQWHDPRQAAAWANDLVKLTNEYSRQKAIAIAQRDVGFLDAQAAKTPYVEEHQAIATILESELTKQMLAEGTDEYSLRVIDPAYAPERPTFPKPLIFAVLGFVAGGLLGCCWALIRYRREDAAGTVSKRWPEAPGATNRESTYGVRTPADG